MHPAPEIIPQFKVLRLHLLIMLAVLTGKALGQQRSNVVFMVVVIGQMLG